MKASFRSFVSAAALALAAIRPALAAGPSDPVPLRLYVLNSADMTVPRAFLQHGGEGTQWVPAAFYLIKHPKGNVLFDTGVNDREIAAPASVWPRPAVDYFGLKRSPGQSIEAQLAKAGVTPSDIRYVVISHLHLDHAGNIAKFPKATFVIQNDELKQAWWPDEGFEGGYLEEDLKDMRRFNVMRLSGNLDLFGDGSIQVLRTPGHTPGSQILLARLPRTGVALFPGDAVFLKDNLEHDRLPGPAATWQASAQLQGYRSIRQLRDAENAKIFYSHDGEEFKSYRQAPAYYD
ncbi:MAG: N-acyl homoserine lactonase family protein [Burkholderiaceae bacterium]|nr:N-acyl homoserine lactonase family protein [Burkholderiaceae bacterium]